MSNEKLPEQGSRAAQIAHLNDECSQQFNDWYLTQGVQALPNLPDLIRAVQTHNKFTTYTDPYGEHDYGSLVWRGVRTLWKIDYYDQQLQYWCDPLSEECRRVLTVMLASEY